jgi:hypothetical protein
MIVVIEHEVEETEKLHISIGGSVLTSALSRLGPADVVRIRDKGHPPIANLHIHYFHSTSASQQRVNTP